LLAASATANKYDVELTTEATADLEWIVELKAKEFETEDEYSLSFLHEWFDKGVVESLHPSDHPTHDSDSQSADSDN
jgi:hypothetical protein